MPRRGRDAADSAAPVIKEQLVNTWVQKSRLELKRGRKGWHCKSYLDGTDGDPNERYPSGGRNSTRLAFGLFEYIGMRTAAERFRRL